MNIWDRVAAIALNVLAWGFMVGGVIYVTWLTVRVWM